MNAVEELEHLKRLFETWEGNGVFVSPTMRETLMEICVRSGSKMCTEWDAVLRDGAVKVSVCPAQGRKAF